MPVHPTEPPHGVDAFATLSALMAHPFADAPALLKEQGIDEAAWRSIEARWADCFQAVDGEPLADRFGDVFAATVRSLIEPAVPSTEREADPHALADVAPPVSGAASPVSPPRPANPLAATLESPVGLPLAPALPFVKP
jgi:hypothetical protein